MNLTDVLGLAAVGVGSAMIARDYAIGGVTTVTNADPERLLILGTAAVVGGYYAGRHLGTAPVLGAILGGAIFQSVAGKQGWA